jgi:hypothetical protein
MFCKIIVGLQVQCGWCGSGCVGWGASQLYNPARNIYIVFLALRLPGYTWSASSIWSVSLPCLYYYEFLTKQSYPCWCQVSKNYTGGVCGNWRLKTGDDTKLYKILFFYGLNDHCLFPHSPILDWQNNPSAILLTVYRELFTGSEVARVWRLPFTSLVLMLRMYHASPPYTEILPSGLLDF